MLALNIALNIDNDNINILNKSIKKNFINFDNSCPHLTLLQFYCNIDNIVEIQEKVKQINFNKIIINNFSFKKEKYYDNLFIYYLEISSKDIDNLRKKILTDFNKFIETPEINLDDMFVSKNVKPK